MGVTTGGMLTSEKLFADGVTDSAAYAWHGPGTVTRYVADSLGCRGPAITVSSACSSGTAVLKVALELVRSGRARTVLAGGADSLCRLTYFGFSFLQLIDPEGARPFDADRAGMSVGEAAGAVLIVAAEAAPPGAIAELAGAGLSCDAHHVTAPHPEGDGAFAAMKDALADAGLAAGDVCYINLHGTGTPGNDASEARAVARLFNEVPACSSTKGIYGHPLAAAGAVEAVIAATCIQHGFVPANTGLENVGEDVPASLVRETIERSVPVVLSNSFGFGGSNAAAVFVAPGRETVVTAARRATGFRVLGASCITSAGGLEETAIMLERGVSCAGRLGDADLAEALDAAFVRRLKRLPRLAIALAEAASRDAGTPPRAVCFATGLGAVTETFGFLEKLGKTGGKFASPTDFVGSLHSSPAGQVAIRLGATGPSVTATGAGDSFEQALYLAQLLSRPGGDTLLCIGADEANETFTPRLDSSATEPLTDGGGALVLEPVHGGDEEDLSILFLQKRAADAAEQLVATLGGPERIAGDYCAVLYGAPRAIADEAALVVARFEEASAFAVPLIEYRQWIGQYQSASACACALMWRFAADGRIPAAIAGREIEVGGKSLLLVGIGDHLSAIRIRAGKGNAS